MFLKSSILFLSLMFNIFACDYEYEECDFYKEDQTLFDNINHGLKEGLGPTEFAKTIELPSSINMDTISEIYTELLVYRMLYNAIKYKVNPLCIVEDLLETTKKNPLSENVSDEQEVNYCYKTPITDEKLKCKKSIDSLKEDIINKNTNIIKSKIFANCERQIKDLSNELKKQAPTAVQETDIPQPFSSDIYKYFQKTIESRLKEEITKILKSTISEKWCGQITLKAINKAIEIIRDNNLLQYCYDNSSQYPIKSIEPTYHEYLPAFKTKNPIVGIWKTTLPDPNKGNCKMEFYQVNFQNRANRCLFESVRQEKEEINKHFNEFIEKLKKKSLKTADENFIRSFIEHYSSIPSSSGNFEPILEFEQQVKKLQNELDPNKNKFMAFPLYAFISYLTKTPIRVFAANFYGSNSWHCPMTSIETYPALACEIMQKAPIYTHGSGSHYTLLIPTDWVDNSEAFLNRPGTEHYKDIIKDVKTFLLEKRKK
ncbi:MAG: hypothetical protein IJ481_01160 [Alphaproteobacteria bacterium]|nr:hypothetical protein [Alphaproteobacteria bacterium]